MARIDTSSWHPFAIGALFEISKGTRLTKADMKSGPIRFVGASAMNNGITAYIGNDDHLQSSGTITVTYNGSVGESFFQDKIFWASDDVNVLYPKFSMSKNIAMFLIPLLKKAGVKYAFVDKWKKEDMEKDKIKLPVDKAGNPDFAYMELYMQKIESKSQFVLNSLLDINSDQKA